MYTNERNITLDYFKLFLAILVVIVHTNPFLSNQTLSFGSLLNWEICNGLSRIAVPCFLLINGYFISQDKKRTTIKHLLIIYIVWTLIYLPLFINENKIEVVAWLVSGYMNLWYILALAQVYVLFIIMEKNNISDKYLLIVAIILFFVGYGLATMKLESPNIPSWLLISIVSRNFLFMGFPFVFIGYYIRKYSLDKQLKQYKHRTIILIIVALLICLLVESYLTLKQYLPGNRDFYISLIMLCPLLFIYVLRISKMKNTDGYISKLASGIFFSHILIILMIRMLFGQSDGIIQLPVILLLSSIVSVGIIALNKRIKLFL